MDVNRLSTGEKVAGVSGVLLILVMFIFDWFSVSVSGSAGGFSFGGSVGGNAWDAYGFTDLVLFITAIAAIALAVTAANATELNMPVALSAVTAGLGALSVLLVLISIISPPDFGAPDVADDFIDVGRSIGVWLGLLLAIGITAGGWMAMQEEGTRVSTTAPPPPPPPPTAPPAA
jgi:hypothetical protein